MSPCVANGESIRPLHGMEAVVRIGDMRWLPARGGLGVEDVDGVPAMDTKNSPSV
jgi:hypothetical protein